jgi:hypothetical protein
MTLEVYRGAHAAHKRAQAWEASGEAWDLGEQEGPVGAVDDVLLAAREAVGSINEPPDAIVQALVTAVSARDAWEAASVAAEEQTPGSIDADHQAWVELGQALDALWLAMDGGV